MQTKPILKWLAGGVVMLALIVTNASIYMKEQLLKHGAIAILELAPVDPRSLMQGDYMVLNYALTQPLQQIMYQQREACLEDTSACKHPSGRLVLNLDERRHVTNAVFDQGQPLQPQEIVMKYHLSSGSLNIGTPSYFFQEGNAERFASARYGEFRVDNDGTALLTYLLDENGKRILP